MHYDDPVFTPVPSGIATNEEGQQVVFTQKQEPEVFALLYDEKNPAEGVLVNYADGTTIIYERNRT